LREEKAKDLGRIKTMAVIYSLTKHGRDYLKRMPEMYPEILDTEFCKMADEAIKELVPKEEEIDSLEPRYLHLKKEEAMGGFE
jgi:hypothetical protein